MKVNHDKMPIILHTYNHIDDGTFRDLCKIVDMLIDEVNSGGDTFARGIHHSLMEAQRLLFSTGAIRYSGSFPTSQDSEEGIHFDLHNFAISVVKTNRGVFRGRGKID